MMSEDNEFIFVYETPKLHQLYSELNEELIHSLTKKQMREILLSLIKIVPDKAEGIFGYVIPGDLIADIIRMREI